MSELVPGQDGVSDTGQSVAKGVNESTEVEEKTNTQVALDHDRETHQSNKDTCCTYCNGAIMDDYLMALGKSWHQAHFLCTVCSTDLSMVEFHEKNGYAYCRGCYHEKFSPRCTSCSKAIILEGFISALGSLWHTECFCRKACGATCNFQRGDYIDFKDFSTHQESTETLPDDACSQNKNVSDALHSSESASKTVQVQDLTTQSARLDNVEQMLKDEIIQAIYVEQYPEQVDCAIEIRISSPPRAVAASIVAAVEDKIYEQPVPATEEMQRRAEAVQRHVEEEAGETFPIFEAEHYIKRDFHYTIRVNCGVSYIDLKMRGEQLDDFDLNKLKTDPMEF